MTTYAIGLLFLMAVVVCRAEEAARRQYGPPGFEEAIQEFERQDRLRFPPPGGIVIIGSSHIRLWTTLHEDLAPLTLIQRGFGGSTFNDALHYAERIVIPYQPRAVVIYSGNNDQRQVDPETVRDACKAFVETVRAQLPKTRIYVMSIPPATGRQWSGRDAPGWIARETTNRLIRAYCEAAGLTWINITDPMFGPDGEPRPELFGSDDIHLSSTGYRLWRDILLPVLLANEAPFDL